MPEQPSQHIDEDDLLALIEDELDADRAEAVRTGLSRDPALRARIELMREDRAALRAVPDPMVPDGLVDRVEAALEQPVVMSPPPGALRRAQARRVRARMWTRIGVAAGLMIVAGVGLWGVVHTVTSGRSGQPIARGGVAAPPGSPSERPATPSGSSLATTDRSAPDEPVTIAAAIPAPGLRRPATPGRAATEPTAAAEAGVADFAIVIRSQDAATVEAALETALAELGTSVALVRNFSEQELLALLDAQRGGPRPRGSQPPDHAGVGSERATTIDPLGGPMVDRGNAPLASRRTPAQARPFSAQLLGPAELAPGIDEQLTFSSRGATHTVTVPASRLPALLVALNESLGSTFALRPLDDDSTVNVDGDRYGIIRWVIDLPKVRDSAERLRESDGALVLLPVVIE